MKNTIRRGFQTIGSCFIFVIFITPGTSWAQLTQNFQFQNSPVSYEGKEGGGLKIKQNENVTDESPLTLPLGSTGFKSHLDNISRYSRVELDGDIHVFQLSDKLFLATRSGATIELPERVSTVAPKLSIYTIPGQEVAFIKYSGGIFSNHYFFVSLKGVYKIDESLKPETLSVTKDERILRNGDEDVTHLLKRVKAVAYGPSLQKCDVQNLKLDPVWEDLYGQSTPQWTEPAPKPESDSDPLKAVDEPDHLNGAITDSATETTVGGAFAYAPASPVDVKVTGPNGQAQSAWELVKLFAKDYVKETHETGFTYSLDPHLRPLEDAVLRNLIKQENGSVRLLAPAGVGKTVLVQRVMARIALGDIPEDLKGYRFLNLVPSAMEAGTSNRGEFEARIVAMEEIAKRNKVVWIIDEIHSFAGAGTTKQNESDAMNRLKTGLANGTIRIIGMTTPDEWDMSFGADPAIERRFGLVMIDPPHGERLLLILENWLKRYNLPTVDRKILADVVRFSDEFNAEGNQPAKSTLLLQDIFARRNMKGLNGPIRRDEVIETVKDAYQVDPAEFELNKAREKYHRLEQDLENLAGQKPAKTALLQMTRSVLVGTQDRTKPRYRLLFAGPKGQGKTEIVDIFGKAVNLPVGRIMMSNYTEAYQINDLKAEIASYVSKNAFTILFFDEIEKAHPKVQAALLAILDCGQMTVISERGNRKIARNFNLRNTSVFMASNAGQTYIATLPKTSAFSETVFREQMAADGLNEYLLDRMEDVVPFFFLEEADFSHVLRIHINKALNGIEVSSGTQVHIPSDAMDALVKYLTKKHFQPKMTNRDALRAVTQTVRNSVTDILFHQGRAAKLTLKFNGQGLEPASRKNNHRTCEGLFSR